MLGEILTDVRERRAIVHCITNYVTANDCANLLLACGASPIMADDPLEAAEIAAMSDALVVNLGTLSPRRLEAMLAAGREANRLGKPVVFDPVGVGCSDMRRAAAQKLLGEIRFTSIRGNASELSVMAAGAKGCRGLDADAGYAPCNPAENACALARAIDALVICTGEADVVTDGNVVYRVHEGHPMMRSVTGAGCQLSALTGAFLAAGPADGLPAALAAVCAMGICGRIAHARLGPMDGNASYRNYIIDAMYQLTAEELEGAKYEVYC